MAKVQRREPLTTDEFAELCTRRSAWAEWTVEGADAQGWEWFVAWCYGWPLSWKQSQRVHRVLSQLFARSDATPQEQEAAACSFDDEGHDRGIRRGPADTYRLLVRARAFVGDGPSSYETLA